METNSRLKDQLYGARRPLASAKGTMTAMAAAAGGSLDARVSKLRCSSVSQSASAAAVIFNDHGKEINQENKMVRQIFVIAYRYTIPPCTKPDGISCSGTHLL